MKKNQDGDLTLKYSQTSNLQEANDFIKHWLGYAVTLLAERVKTRYKYSDRDVVQSSALEGLYQAFCALEKKAEKPWLEKMVKGFIKQSIFRCLYQQYVYFQLIPCKKRVYFPKQWVDWSEWLKGVEIPPRDHSIYDINELMKKGIFSEAEKRALKLYILGYNYVEIAEITGYLPKSIHQSVTNCFDRLKIVPEKDYVPKRRMNTKPYNRKHLSE